MLSGAQGKSSFNVQFNSNTLWSTSTVVPSSCTDTNSKFYLQFKCVQSEDTMNHKYF